MTIPLSVLITTYNEEINIDDCLKSCEGRAGETIIVDSFSNDKTLEIARQYKAKIVQHEYVSPPDQKNWALDTIPFENEWVLILDADERVTTELWQEIADIVSRDGGGYAGYNVNRKYYFYGKWMKHSGWYPSWNLRLFKRTLGRYEDRKVHEHVILDGPVGFCKYDLIHEDRRDFNSWMTKQVQFAYAEAKERSNASKRQKTKPFLKTIFFGDPIEKKRALKENVWMHLPFRTVVRFVYLYFVRLGFLDGARGLKFCLLWTIMEYLTLTYYWELVNYKDGAPPGAINTHSFGAEKKR